MRQGSTGSGLDHLFMRIKDVSLKLQVNADGLRLRPGLLVHFGAALAFLLGGEKLLGVRTEAL